MRTLVAITILTGLILVLSIVPGHTHGVNWGVSVNFGVPIYGTYAPAYPVYPAYAYPPPPYPVYGAGFIAVPRPPVYGPYHRPYHPHYHRHHWR